MSRLNLHDTDTEPQRSGKPCFDDPGPIHNTRVGISCHGQHQRSNAQQDKCGATNQYAYVLGSVRHRKRTNGSTNACASAIGHTSGSTADMAGPALCFATPDTLGSKHSRLATTAGIMANDPAIHKIAMFAKPINPWNTNETTSSMCHRFDGSEQSVANTIFLD